MIRSLLGSEKQQVKLGINLPFQSVSAGATLKGKVVCVVICKSIIQGESILLAISGQEHASVKKRESGRRICRLDVELNDFCDRRLEPGRIYTFPFSIKLPASLPASCTAENGSVNLKVEYTITATGMSSRVRTQKVFQVSSAPLPDERVPCVQRPVSQPVKALNGMIDRGILTLAARVKDTHVGRGDRIVVSISCRNDSLVDIQRVELKVQEIVAGDVTSSRTGNFPADKTFKHDLYVKKQLGLMGLRHKAATMAQMERALSMSSAERENEYAQIYQELSEDAHVHGFLCPETARDSYKGKLIHIRHQIKIKIITNSLTDNPSIVIPIKVGNPPKKRTTAAIPSLRSIPGRSATIAEPTSIRSRAAATGVTEPSRRPPTRTMSDPDHPSTLMSLRHLEPLAPPPMPIRPPQASHPESATNIAVPSQCVPEMPTPRASSKANPSAETNFHRSLPPPVAPPMAPPSEAAMRFSASALNAASPTPQLTHSTPILPPPSAPTFEFSSPALPATAPPPLITQSTPVLPPASAPTLDHLSASSSAILNAMPVLPSAPYSLEEHIPFLTATPVPMDAIDAPTTVIDPEFVVLGGDAIELEEEPGENDNIYHPAPASAPPPINQPPSVELLLQEMLICVEDFHIIRTKLQSENWRFLFSTMSPEEFGSIIVHVNIDQDQPRVASLLAPHLNGGIFTCEFCAAAVRSTSAWNRPSVVERLAPSCVDLRQNCHLIRAQLNEWDQIITASILHLR